MSEHTTDPTYTPVERHIFLCATPTKPKCHSDSTGAECWDYLKKRLSELGYGHPGKGGIHRTTLGALPEVGQQAGIRGQAMVITGPTLGARARSHRPVSSLYDASFSHMFRRGES